MAKIEDLVLTIDQMYYLQKMGVEIKDTAMAYFPTQIGIGDDGLPEYSRNEYSVYFAEGNNGNCIPTLTFQEILQLLPKTLQFKGVTLEFRFNYSIPVGYEFAYIPQGRTIYNNVIFTNGNPLQGAYDTLCWVANVKRLNK